MWALFNHFENHFSVVGRGGLIIVAVLLAGISLSRVVYPYDVGHFEACTWTPAELSAQGKNPYAFARQEPFVMAPYGYLYYLAVGAGLRLFGGQFWFGRLLTVLALIVCVGCVMRLCRAMTERRDSAWLAGLSVLTSLPVFHWSAVHRPDLPALALAFGALALAYPARAQSIGRTLFVAGLLVAAVFCKQTTVLPIAVIAARYWQTDRRKQALLLLAGVATLGAALAVVLNATSAGGYFWQHFVLMRQVPHSYALSWHWLGSLGRAPGTWLSLAVVALGTWRQIRQPREKTADAATPPTVQTRWRTLLASPVSLLSVYLLAAVALAFVTSARSGSYVNYYLESVLVLALLTGLGWHWWQRQPSAASTWQRGMILFCALFVAAGAVECWRLARAESDRWQSLPYYREIVETLKRDVPPDALVLSVHPELALAAGHAYHFGDFLQYQDGRSAVLSDILQEQLRNRRYGAIVWLTPDDPRLAGYQLRPMPHSVRPRYYPVYLFLRSDREGKQGE